MPPLKIQHIRFCQQCRELLPTKCQRCVAHPDRKPRTVALYDRPPILATAPCGCVKIRCQRAACGGDAWKKLKEDGQLADRNLYCSRKCARIDVNTLKRKSEDRACDECGTVKRRPPSAIAPSVFFCSTACRWINYRKVKHAREELLARARHREDRSILRWCGECDKATVHDEKNHSFLCRPCLEKSAVPA